MTSSQIAIRALSPEHFIEAEYRHEPPSALSNRVQSALHGLPCRQREAIELYVQCKEEYTFEQMGHMMQITADGFEKNLERAMKRLRRTLHMEGSTRK